MFESNWTTPAPVLVGKATVTQASPFVTFDATASTALSAIVAGQQFFTSLINQRQFRVGIGTIYNIWNYSINGGVVTLTLDRPYQEASGTTAYMVYQCYYAVPYPDFVHWISIRDIVNFNVLSTTCTRAEIDRRDPQRSIFYIPTHAVPYQIDQNPLSLTFGSMLWELWGQPNFQLTYQLYGLRKGADLVNPTDTLPAAVGEDCVREAARVRAYEWAMANQGDVPRGQGIDYKFLMGAAAADYTRLYKDYRKRDREVVDNFRAKFRRSTPGLVGPYYSSINGVASPGAPW
jgi:hypothetical protein